MKYHLMTITIIIMIFGGLILFAVLLDWALRISLLFTSLFIVVVVLSILYYAIYTTVKLHKE